MTIQNIETPKYLFLTLHYPCFKETKASNKILNQTFEATVLLTKNVTSASFSGGAASNRDAMARVDAVVKFPKLKNILFLILIQSKILQKKNELFEICLFP